MVLVVPNRAAQRKAALPTIVAEIGRPFYYGQRCDIAALAAFSIGASARDIAKTFGRATEARVDRIEEILVTLATLGKARKLGDDWYVAV